jgi:hypothetical protein
MAALPHADVPPHQPVGNHHRQLKRKSLAWRSLNLQPVAWGRV